MTVVQTCGHEERTVICFNSRLIFESCVCGEELQTPAADVGARARLNCALERSRALVFVPGRARP